MVIHKCVINYLLFAVYLIALSKIKSACMIKKMPAIICIASLLVFTSVYGKGSPKTSEEAEQLLKGSTLGFEKNIGQVRSNDKKALDNIIYIATIGDASVYISTTGITYIFKKVENEDKAGEDEKQPVQWSRIDMKLNNASINSTNVVEEDASDDYVNYYLPACPKGLLALHRYGKLTIKNIYPNIDWVLYGDASGLKYDFVLHPGSNPKDISLSYLGAKDINTTGSMLMVKSLLGELKEGALNCYQGTPSSTIPSSYKLNKNNLSYQIGSYNANADLTIDPPVQVLQWSTYYAADNHIGPRGMCTDVSGNLYVTGYTDASFFPTQDQGGGDYYNGTYNVNTNQMAFIIKFNSADVKLWSTYYGGSAYDWGSSVATDAAGDLFMSGWTGSGDLPLMNPGGGAYFQNTLNGGYNTFLAKFNTAGAMVWATFYGGSIYDYALGVDVDATGNFWVTGYTSSSDFPVLNPGGGAYFNGTYGGGSNQGDAFILKFDNNGVRQWATFYGGSANDVGYFIKTAPSGDVFVTGATGSNNFPTLNMAGAYFQGAKAGDTNIFVARFSNTGIQKWSTYFGGSGDDGNTNNPRLNGSLTLDRTGNLYVTGATNSPNFPTHNAGGSSYFQAANAGGEDAFIAKFRPSGALAWSTYFGGSSDDEGNSVVTDTNGTVYVTGESYSSSIPGVNPGNGAYYQAANGGVASDIFITEFDSTGGLYWGTLFGGNNDDWSDQAVITPKGCLAVTGEWQSSTGITTLNPGGGAYYQAAFSGVHDGYVMKFCPACATPIVKITSLVDTLCPEYDSASLAASGAATYKWSPATGLSCINCPNPNAKPSGSTTYKVVGSVGGGCKDSATVTINVFPSPVINITPSTTINVGDSITLSATGGGTYNWSPASGLSCTTCPNPVAKPGATTTYCVIVQSPAGCTNSDCVTITTQLNCGDVFVPTAFSPNGDNENDVLYVRGKCIATLDFTIFDRWGNKVFETQDPSIGWDGTYKGIIMNTGSFVYYLKATTVAGDVVTKKGSIALVR